jgi:hypothetical protein
MPINWNTLDNYTVNDMSSLLKYPSTIDTFFWAYLMFAIFMIIALTFYFRDKRTYGDGNFLSASAVSSFVTIMLTVVLTLMGIIENSLMVMILVIGVILIFIWFMKKDD